MSITSISLSLLAIGVAADNLVFAGINGVGVALSKSYKGILLVCFLFLLQNEMLMFAERLALFPMIERHTWVVLLTLCIIAAKLTYGSHVVEWDKRYFTFDAKKILIEAFNTSLYVFTFGFAARCLYTHGNRMSFLPLLFAFFFVGLIFGIFHKDTFLKKLHHLGVLYFLCGLILLTLQLVIFKK